MSEEPHEELSSNAKIELAKALLAVRSVASQAEYEQIRSILTTEATADQVDRAVQGLSKEDEFVLMCRLMGTATHLTHLEQRPVVPGDYIVPDFLARFQPGCAIHDRRSSESKGMRCLVEVKSTTRDRFKIGGKKLRRLRAFADEFGLPLVFAVRFLRFGDYAVWVMVEDSDRTATSLTASYSDMATGLRRVLWDEYLYYVPANVSFRATFDSAVEDDGLSVLHKSFGVQRAFQIVWSRSPDDPDPKVFDLSKPAAFLIPMFLEGFGLREEKVECSGTQTVQTLRAENMMCSVADMIYRINRLPMDTSGRVALDPSRILTGADEGRWLMGRDTLDMIARDLANAGILSWVGFGEPESHLNQWIACGGEPTARGSEASPDEPSNQQAQQCHAHDHSEAP